MPERRSASRASDPPGYAELWLRRLWRWMSQWDAPLPISERRYGINCVHIDDDTCGRVGAQGQG